MDYQKHIEKLDFELAMLVRRASSITVEKRLGNLDRSGYLIIHYLERQVTQGQGMKAMAEEFRLDTSTMSRQIAALEAKGYVERFADPTDGRASLLQVTKSGKEEFQRARTARIDRFYELLTGWTDEEIDQFTTFIERLNHTD